MLNNWVALAITFGLALSWLRLNDYLAARGWISGSLSRKIIHMGTGPLFVLCWLLFKDTASSRYLAALVPAAITVQFALVGLGLMADQASVDAMTRHGDPQILRGPLFYGIVFVVLTILYWKNSPIGMTALMLLCGGDGLADVVWEKNSPEQSITLGKSKNMGRHSCHVLRWLDFHGGNPGCLPGERSISGDNMGLSASHHIDCADWNAR